MRSALEKRYGMVEEKLMPAKEIVEKKLAEVEAGEYRAEDLTEVVSKDEVEPTYYMGCKGTPGNEERFNQGA